MPSFAATAFTPTLPASWRTRGRALLRGRRDRSSRGAQERTIGSEVRGRRRGQPSRQRKLPRGRADPGGHRRRSSGQGRSIGSRHQDRATRAWDRSACSRPDSRVRPEEWRGRGAAPRRRAGVVRDRWSRRELRRDRAAGARSLRGNSPRRCSTRRTPRSDRPIPSTFACTRRSDTRAARARAP